MTNEYTTFFGVFFLMFFVTSVFLYGIDFIPEPKTTGTDFSAETITATPEVMIESPTRVVIKKIGVDTLIENPTSAAIEVLDEALLAGAVRYPGSALLGENAPIFLFGHQSHLPVVKNKAFKAFNNIQNLSTGDVIEVHSDTAVYQYTVESVELVRADDALIPLTAGEKTLILSTCNSFGDPGERYVLTARYTTRTPLP